MRRLNACSVDAILCVTIVVGIFLASACSIGERRAQRIPIKEMLSSGQSLDGVRLRIEGCIKSNPHGILINECNPNGIGIPLLFSKGADRHAHILYERGMVLEAVQGKEVVAVLCGSYSQTPDGKDRWFEVDSFLIGGRSYRDGSNCTADGEGGR